MLKALTISGLLLAAGPVEAQALDWREVAPENLLVIDTTKGRIVVELDPRIAPRAVERVRTLADQGFYDGLKFHRVITGFMAQGGDPQGTGQGGSDLPDIAAEFSFRRGRDAGFAPVDTAGQTTSTRTGLVGVMPVVTQPDAQMMVTADFKTSAQAVFCPGVVGMARAQAEESANSQFFIMTARRPELDGTYTPFGRVLSGMDAARALKVGAGANGQVADPDVMTRVRTAAGMPAGERPTARVMNANGAAFAARLAEIRAARGQGFTICDAQPAAEVSGA